MIIQWIGQSCFKIQTKNNGNEVTIVTDPYDDKTGLKMPKIQADIVTVSHNHHDHNNLDAIKGDPFVINTPGEYETKEVLIYGIPSYHDDKKGSERGNNTIYKLVSEEIHLAHLGDLGQTLTDEQLEKIGTVDVLMIPVGGKYTIDYKKAIEVISQLEPRIVIPMHYKIDGLTSDVATVDEFIKNCGLPLEKMDKLKILKKDLPPDTTKLVILSPNA
ncbi:MAG: MBL fold metallo-hydrolase [Patescibacteria group bacterium]|jgi:L-ascorbate metabolism protein UlaG (beta-lactamase superfamily)